MVRIKVCATKKRARAPNLESGDPKPKRKSRSGVGEVFFVDIDSDGGHYMTSSLDPTVIILAPPEVSRADGDVDRASPPPYEFRPDDHPVRAIKPYDFEAAITWKLPAAEYRHAELVAARKTPLPLVYFDVPALVELDIYDEVHRLCVGSGLNFVFRNDPGTYPKVTLEFLSYFEPIYHETNEGISGVKSWTFGLGGYLWNIKADVIRDWLRLPRDGLIPKADNDIAVDFWREITGNSYAGDHETSNIIVKEWRVIHRMIASNIFVRTNRGRLVSKLELNIMRLMKKGRPIDWLWCITEGLVDNCRLSGPNRSLGGGSIITLIAEKLGYTFGGGTPLRESFTIDKMRFMSIIGKGNSWSVEKKGKGKAIGAAGSSLEAQFESLCKREARFIRMQGQFNEWHKESLLALAKHFQIPLNPPPDLIDSSDNDQA